MIKKNPKVDAYLGRQENWQKESKALRKIALDCGLTEELKWGKPCYTFENSNIVIIQGFKESCGLLFFKGVLLKDPKKILKKQGENSQSARDVRFASVQEITKNEATLKAYIREAIKLEQSGAKVKLKKITDHKVPEELQKVFVKSATFKKAFQSLTPGRQRAYLLHFSSPKQSATRESRIEKCKKQILAGKGLNDL